jgi:hypothetical protein
MMTYDNFQFSLGYELLNSKRQDSRDELSEVKSKSKQEHLGTEYDNLVQQEVDEESEYLNFLFHKE